MWDLDNHSVPPASSNLTDFHSFESGVAEYSFSDSDNDSIGELDMDGPEDNEDLQDDQVFVPHVRLGEEIVD